MIHFKLSLFKAMQAPLDTVETVIDGLTESFAWASHRKSAAISYTLKPDFVKTFAHSGYPFLTFYEFTDLVGWYRDNTFAPENVPGYADEIGKVYTVWTHETSGAYRRHIILDELKGNIEISFEIPSLEASAWFPLRIMLYDTNGLYFQTDQKLVVEAIRDGSSALTSWKKVPQLREALPRLHALTKD